MRIFFTASLVLLVGCDPGDRDGLDDGAGTGAVAQQSSLAVPSVAPQPANNPASAAKVELGRLLFWDPILSGGRDLACATCHHPAFAYADSRTLSVGAGGTGLGPSRAVSPPAPHRTTRNSMTVLNAAFNGLGQLGATIDPLLAPMFWDSRALSLEQQARGPITALDEMRGPQFTATEIFPELVGRVSAIPEYATRFAEAFPDATVSETTITEAIATFERTVNDSNSSYDRFVKGDPNAMSASAQRGMQVFNRNGCTNCHTGPMFSDFKLHRLGVPDLPGAPHDVGNGANLFRTASLRNVARTAPYMHNGVFVNLDAVFNFYDDVDRRLDPNLQGLRAPQRQDATDVKAFLSALSDGTFDQTIPATVPSGLVPAGTK
jgi:cytochrome c peroxidase